MSEPNAAVVNSTENVDAALQTVIDEQTIMANSGRLVWQNLVWEKPLTGKGNSVTFPKLSALAVVTEPLAATSNPDGVQAEDDSEVITVLPYGNLAEFQLELELLSKEDIPTDKIALLAVNMAESHDAIIAVPAVAGSNVRVSAGRANAAALTVGDVLTYEDVIAARSFLDDNGAPTFDDGTFYAMVRSCSYSDLLTGGNLGDFQDVTKYANPETFRTGEIGRFAGFTFFKPSQGNIANNGAGAAAGGNTVGDLVKNVFAGKGAIGYAYHTKPSVKSKPMGDKMDRFTVVYWKGLFGVGRVREENLLRVISRSNYAPHK